MVDIISMKMKSPRKIIKILEKKFTNHYADNILIYFELMEFIYFIKFVQASEFPHIPNSFNEYLNEYLINET
jgi:hypothetical protein